MAGYHAFFSDWFRLRDTATADTTVIPNTPAGVVDMRGWDAVAFLLSTGDGYCEMADMDDFGPTGNVVAPIIEVDYGRPICTPGATLPAPFPAPGGTTEYPFWLEVWRPTKRFVRVNGLQPLAFLYRGTGLRPPIPAPYRSGGRAS